jgi:non-ribosomal peptide synthetase component F
LHTALHIPCEFQALAKIFEQQVEQIPDQVALSGGVHEITYRELNTKANQVAHYLLHCGISPGQLVALYLERSVESVVVLLGTLKAGGAYVPLDRGMPAERVNAILRDCQPRVLVTREALRTNIALDVPALINLDTDWPVIESQPSCNFNVTLAEDSLLYVIYTSGLTGHPKAVRGIYQGIINRLRWTWSEYPFQEQEIACHRVSISAVDHVAEIFAPLLKGTPLVILSDVQANDPEELVLTLARKKITRLVVVPSLLKSMLSVRKDLVFHLSHLKYVFCSGEALSKALAGLFYQRFKQVRLINIYGATETSADATWYEVMRSDVDNVLAYFSRALDFSGVISTGSQPDGGNHTVRGMITATNVPVEKLATHFKQTRMAECPTNQGKYTRGK